MSELQEYVERIADDVKNAADLMEYIEDALEVLYIVTESRTYCGARILITYGGPNVWIDTMRGTIDGFWGSDRAATELPRCDEINEILEDVYNAQ
jgi:hypothetical protein